MMRALFLSVFFQFLYLVYGVKFAATIGNETFESDAQNAPYARAHAPFAPTSGVLYLATVNSTYCDNTESRDALSQAFKMYLQSVPAGEPVFWVLPMLLGSGACIHCAQLASQWSNVVGVIYTTLDPEFPGVDLSFSEELRENFPTVLLDYNTSVLVINALETYEMMKSEFQFEKRQRQIVAPMATLSAPSEDEIRAAHSDQAGVRAASAMNGMFCALSLVLGVYAWFLLLRVWYNGGAVGGAVSRGSSSNSADDSSNRNNRNGRSSRASRREQSNDSASSFDESRDVSLSEDGKNVQGRERRGSKLSGSGAPVSTSESLSRPGSLSGKRSGAKSGSRLGIKTAAIREKRSVKQLLSFLNVCILLATIGSILFLITTLVDPFLWRGNLGYVKSSALVEVGELFFEVSLLFLALFWTDRTEQVMSSQGKLSDGMRRFFTVIRAFTIGAGVVIVLWFPIEMAIGGTYYSYVELVVILLLVCLFLISGAMSVHGLASKSSTSAWVRRQSRDIALFVFTLGFFVFMSAVFAVLNEAQLSLGGIAVRTGVNGYTRYIFTSLVRICTVCAASCLFLVVIRNYRMRT